MERTLVYYSQDGTCKVFTEYTIDTDCNITNTKTKKQISKKIENGYLSFNASCKKKSYHLSVARAMLSTFNGEPPTLSHTADHIKSKEVLNNSISNLRWSDRKEQRANQKRPKTYKSAFKIIQDNLEMTANGWASYYKKNYDKDYKKKKFNYLARNKIDGFSYKEYPDYHDEEWKQYTYSNNVIYKISNMNRIKYITSYAEHVIDSKDMHKASGYPVVSINGVQEYAHIIVFKLFFPEQWGQKIENEIVLHEDDNKLDFRPHKLRLGTPSMNGHDAYDNGRYDETNRERKQCVMYDINGNKINDFRGSSHAAEYIINIRNSGNIKIIARKIRGVLDKFYKDGVTCRTAYGYIWKSD